VCCDGKTGERRYRPLQKAEIDEKAAVVMQIEAGGETVKGLSVGGVAPGAQVHGVRGGVSQGDARHDMKRENLAVRGVIRGGHGFKAGQRN